MAQNGKITIHGSAKTEAFIRTSAEMFIGDTQVQLESSAHAENWKVGDKIVVPHSSPCLEDKVDCRRDYRTQSEDRTITAISPDGLTLTISEPLIHTHE
ncbi:MAG: hypothetical protein GY827_08130 [Cytophagales bacterium]|nr:hypothetical protein [Cytophagales bacterium]